MANITPKHPSLARSPRLRLSSNCRSPRLGSPESFTTALEVPRADNEAASKRLTMKLGGFLDNLRPKRGLFQRTPDPQTDGGKLSSALSTPHEQRRRCFRCDIHATSSEDHISAETECRQLIIEAGGTLIDDIAYLGGFLFELPSDTVQPLESGDKTALGGSITVNPWTPFPTPDVKQDRPWTHRSLGDNTPRKLQKAPPLSVSPRVYSIAETGKDRHSPRAEYSTAGPDKDPFLDKDGDGMTWRDVLLKSTSKGRKGGGKRHGNFGNADEAEDWETVASNSMIGN